MFYEVRRRHSLRLHFHHSKPVPKVPKFACRLFPAFLLLGICGVLKAQIQSVSDLTSRPTFGSGHEYIRQLGETVNPATGSLNLKISIPMPAGRQLALPFSFEYNSNEGEQVGEFAPGWATYRGSVELLQQGNWTYSIPRINLNRRLEMAADQQTCEYAADFVFTDSSGGRHALNPMGNALNLVLPSGPLPNPPCNFTSNVANWLSGGDQDYTGLLGPVTTPGTDRPLSVYDNFGNLYYFPDPFSPNQSLTPSYMEDRNGNRISFAMTPDGGVTYTDTLQRTVLSVSAPSSTSSTVSVSGINNPYQINWGSIAYNYTTPEQIIGTPGDGTNCHLQLDESGSGIGATGVQLPDGTGYTFKYDPVYGKLSEIDYPNGAWVKYTWKASDNYDQEAVFNGGQITTAFSDLSLYMVTTPTGEQFITPPGYPVDALTEDNQIVAIGSGHIPVTEPVSGACHFHYSSPVIDTRSVGLANSNSPILTQKFTYSTTWGTSFGWTQKQTTIQTTDLIRNLSSTEVHTYLPANGTSSPNDSPSTGIPEQISAESVTQVYDWTSSPAGVGPLLATTYKGWYNNSLSVNSTQLLQLACEFTTDNSGQTSGRFYGYTFGQVSDVKEYDYGQVTTPSSVCAGFGPVAPVNPIRETATSFQTFNGPQGTVFGEPSSTVVYSGGTRVAEADNIYDGSTIAPAVAVSHDDTLYGAGVSANRGNLTTHTQRCIGCADAMTTFTYDQTGQLVSMTDPCGNTSCSDMSGVGHTTTYSYTDSFVSGTGQPAGNTNAFLTAVVQPPVNGVSFTTTYTYGFNDGRTRSVTDVNGQTTSFCYITGGCTGATADPWDRLTQIVSPDGGTSTAAYVDTGTQPTITVSQLQSAGGPSETHTSQFDGLGRETASILTSDPAGATSIDTAYDGLGRVYTKSNPHRAASSATDGTTTYSYDALGRRTLQTQQDGTSLQWSYAGPVVISIDERSASWQHTYDAFGRLTKVFEPAAPPQCAGTRCRIFWSPETDYTYDALGNLTNVNQLGDGSGSPVTRSFTYDSLSRLLTAQNPETGLVCYGVLTSGNCASGYDANGNLMQKTDARNVVTTYSYDVHNRLTQKVSNDGIHGASIYGWDGNRVTFVPPPGDPRPHTVFPVRNGIGRLYFAWGSDIATGYSTLHGYSYDAVGRVIGQAVSTPSYTSGSPVFSAAFSYNLAGELTDITYPSGRTVTQHYDTAGRLQTVSAGTTGSPGSPYASQITYYPDGSPHQLTYGNSTVEGLTKNNRFQPCQQTASLGFMTFLNRSYSYSPNNTSVFCGSEASNNGDIWHIVDNLPGQTMTEHFNYDVLNRLTSFQGPNMAGALRQQTFTYDSFGNIEATNAYSTSSIANNTGTPSARMFPNPGYNPAIWPYDGNNRLIDATFDCTGANGLHYDASGNVQCDGSNTDLDARRYTWDAESHIIQESAQHGGNTYDLTAVYTYDGNSDRIRSDQYLPGSTAISSWREYLQLNGLMLSELNSDSSLTDYIYAGGRKIAKVDGYDERIHLSGSNCSGCGSTNTFAGTQALIGSAGGHVIQPGDTLVWRQFQTGTASGGISMWFGSTGLPSLQDQDGQYIDHDTVMNRWHERRVDLTPSANSSIALFTLWNYTNGAPGDWDIYFGDISIVGADGTVTPIYNRQMTTFSSTFVETAETRFSIATEKVPDTNPLTTATYYLADQVGTSQMELAGGGWPVWEGHFAPFGQEVDTEYTAMRYKFTGKERDAESGLDYFGARYYGSNMGRWLSPDWAAAPAAVPYADLSDPQSLNLYVYALNDPVDRRDADGHCIPWCLVTWIADGIATEGGKGFAKDVGIGTLKGLGQVGYSLLATGMSAGAPNPGASYWALMQDMPSPLVPTNRFQRGGAFIGNVVGTIAVGAITIGVTAAVPAAVETESSIITSMIPFPEGAQPGEILPGIDPSSLQAGRPVLDSRALSRALDNIANGVETKPIEVNTEGVIYDGNHRAAAAAQTNNPVTVQVVDKPTNAPSGPPGTQPVH